MLCYVMLCVFYTWARGSKDRVPVPLSRGKTGGGGLTPNPKTPGTACPLSRSFITQYLSVSDLRFIPRVNNLLISNQTGRIERGHARPQ